MLVHFKALKKPNYYKKKSSYNKNYLEHNGPSAWLNREGPTGFRHTKQVHCSFRDTARVSGNTGSTSVVLRATELQQPYMLICISSDKSQLEKSIQAL